MRAEERDAIVGVALDILKERPDVTLTEAIKHSVAFIVFRMASVGKTRHFDYNDGIEASLVQELENKRQRETC